MAYIILITLNIGIIGLQITHYFVIKRSNNKSNEEDQDYDQDDDDDDEDEVQNEKETTIKK